MQGRFTSPDEFTGGPDELYFFVDDASENPTFYADLSNPQSLNKYQYTYNNPLRYVDPDGHETAPDPDPQDPCGCANIQKQANKIRADIEKLDEITSKPLFPITDLIGTSDPGTIGPVALTNDQTTMAPLPLPKDAATPQSNAQPQAPPAPIQAHKKKKQSTGKNKDHPKERERPGRPNTKDRQNPNWRPRQRPPGWPKNKPWPPWRNPKPTDWPKYKPWPPKPEPEQPSAPKPPPGL